MSMEMMVGIATGGILNIILDPIFIFALNMGTAGAALATALSQAVSFVILLMMCNTKADALSIRFKNFKPSLKIYGRILYNGVPSLGRQGIASISTILRNTAAGVYGDAAIAAMSIVSRYTLFINSSVIGFGQGFQPVCGFSYGAGKFRRVREAFWFCVKVSGGPYHYDVVRGLIAAAEKMGAPYAVDVYPRYGSDVEATLRAGYDIRHGLIGSGVYASHGYERSHVEGALATLKTLIGYVG